MGNHAAEQDIPVLKSGLEMKPPTAKQPEADETSRKLYNELLPGVVQVATDKGAGSGFFVDQSGRVVTDAHVVLGSNEQYVITSDGKRHKARVEKLDDIHDLASLTVDGVKNVKPLQLGDSSTLKPDQKIWALGHPLGSRPAYVSPGYFRFDSTMANMLANLDPDLFLGTLVRSASMTPKEQKDVEGNLTRRLVHGMVKIVPGNSGGPLVDADGKVVAVADMIDTKDPSQSYHTPVENVRELLESKDGNFKATYNWTPERWVQAYKNNWMQHQSFAIAETGAAGLAAWAGGRIIWRHPRLAAVGGSIYGASMLAGDLQKYSNSTDSRDSWKYGLRSAADTVITGGALAALSSRARLIGLASAGVALAGRLATDFIPNHLTMTDLNRTDGDPRPPYDFQRKYHSKVLTMDKLPEEQTKH